MLPTQPIVPAVVFALEMSFPARRHHPNSRTFHRSEGRYQCNEVDSALAIGHRCEWDWTATMPWCCRRPSLELLPQRRVYVYQPSRARSCHGVDAHPRSSCPHNAGMRIHVSSLHQPSPFPFSAPGRVEIQQTRRQTGPKQPAIFQVHSEMVMAHRK